MKFSWAVYLDSAPRESDRWAASDRGWCHCRIPGIDQGDDGFGSECVGNYVKYGPPFHDKIHFHACAYYHEVAGGMLHNHSLGYAEFNTAEEARTWIESRITERFESPVH